MTSMPPSIAPAAYEPLSPECLPNYDLLITEDNRPVDNAYSERQHRLLTDVLAVSWKGPGSIDIPRWVATDVALYFADGEPPLVPDVFVSLGIDPPANPLLKENRCYFVWRFGGKYPEMIVEVVSNREGGELTEKLQAYERLRILHYVVWDPFQFLGETKLHCFALERDKFVSCEPWFPVLQLGVKSWEGVFDRLPNVWLRWCDQNGVLLPNGEEEHRRADQEQSRAERLAAQLRALGVEPDESR